MDRETILQQLGNIPENWLLNSIMRQEMIFFGHTKRHGSLEREIFEGITEGRRGRGRPKRRRSQDIADRMNMNGTEAGRCSQDRDAYRRAVNDTTCQGASAT